MMALIVIAEFAIHLEIILLQYVRRQLQLQQLLQPARQHAHLAMDFAQPLKDAMVALSLEQHVHLYFAVMDQHRHPLMLI
jgi:hypothetical protein